MNDEARRSFRHLNIRISFVIRHSLFVIDKYQRNGRSTRNRYCRSAPLFCHHHFHRPLHGPEGGEPQRLPRSAVAQFRGGPCSPRSSLLKRAPAFSARRAKALRCATTLICNWRSAPFWRVSSRQLRLHQAVYRLQSLFDLRISHRAFRRARRKTRHPLFSCLRVFWRPVRACM